MHFHQSTAKAPFAPVNSSDALDSGIDPDLDWKVFDANNTAECFQYHPQPNWDDPVESHLNTTNKSLYQQLPAFAVLGRGIEPSYDEPYALGVSTSAYDRDLTPSLAYLSSDNLHPQQILSHSAYDYHRRLNSPNESILSSNSGSGYRSPDYSFSRHGSLNQGDYGSSSSPYTASSGLSRSPTLSLQLMPDSQNAYIHNWGDQVTWSKEAGVDPCQIQPQQRLYDERPASVPYMTATDSRHASCARDIAMGDDRGGLNSITENQTTDAANHAIMQDERGVVLHHAEICDDEIEDQHPQAEEAKSDNDPDYSPSRKNARSKPKHRRRSSTNSDSNSNSNNTNTTTTKTNPTRKISPTSKITKSTTNTRRPHRRTTSSLSTSSLKSTSTTPTTNPKRPYTCPLTPYGCASTFATKNEWKRHTTSQHLRLGFWRCDLCPDAEARPNDFNRKDLFTQHLRRMHCGGRRGEGCVLEGFGGVNGATAQNGRVSGEAPTMTSTPVLDAALERTRTRCWTSLRSGPTELRCAFCEKCFKKTPPKSPSPGNTSTNANTNANTKNNNHGNKSAAVGAVIEQQCADEWLEHVGRHLGAGDQKEAGGVAWERDELLRGWMVEEGLLVPVVDGKGESEGEGVEEGRRYVLAERGCGR